MRCLDRFSVERSSGVRNFTLGALDETNDIR
jgi:hypothetical protein